MASVLVKIKSRFDNKELKKILKEFPSVKMRVGWAKTQKEHNGMRTAEVAYLNEVGHNIVHNGAVVGHVVARPLLGLTCEENAQYWAQNWRILFRKYLAGDYDSLATIAQKFCQIVIQDIRRMVEEEQPFAPNAPSTQKRKKALGHSYDIPLLDYGTMIDTLTQEIHIAR